jgi:hypothetical protein
VTTTNRPEFAAQLAALAYHLTEHPGLPEIYDVTERLGGGLQVRLMLNQGEQALAVWAASLPAPVTSHIYRCNPTHVDGHLLSQLGGHVFEVVGSLPDDAAPAESGRHEWTVTR